MRRLVLLDLGYVFLVLLALGVSWRIWGQWDVQRDGPLVVVDTPWIDLGRIRWLAGVGGTLDIEGGCAYLGHDPVVWPEGTRWLERAQAVQLPSGELAREGDVVAGTGGYFELDRGKTAGLLAGCHGLDEVAVFDDHDHPEVVPAH